jgi:hypothetical protein
LQGTSIFRPFDGFNRITADKLKAMDGTTKQTPLFAYVGGIPRNFASGDCHSETLSNPDLSGLPETSQ